MTLYVLHDKGKTEINAYVLREKNYNQHIFSPNFKYIKTDIINKEVFDLEEIATKNLKLIFEEINSINYKKNVPKINQSIYEQITSLKQNYLAPV